MHVLIASCGWLGQTVPRRLMACGDRMTGARSGRFRAKELRGLGVEPLALDLAKSAALSGLPEGIDAILALQSARDDGEARYRRAYLEMNRTLLELIRRRPLRTFVYSGADPVGLPCGRGWCPS